MSESLQLPNTQTLHLATKTLDLNQSVIPELSCENDIVILASQSLKLHSDITVRSVGESDTDTSERKGHTCPVIKKITQALATGPSILLSANLYSGGLLSDEFGGSAT